MSYHTDSTPNLLPLVAPVLNRDEISTIRRDSLLYGIKWGVISTAAFAGLTVLAARAPATRNLFRGFGVSISEQMLGAGVFCASSYIAFRGERNRLSAAAAVKHTTSPDQVQRGSDVVFRYQP